METIPWLIVCVCVYLLTKRRYTTTATINELMDAPKPNHTITRVWESYEAAGGDLVYVWHWKCKCYTQGTEYSEEEAVAAFHKHASLYPDPAAEHYKRLYEKTAAEFAQYKADCYCKDIKPTT